MLADLCAHPTEFIKQDGLRAIDSERDLASEGEFFSQSRRSGPTMVSSSSISEFGHSIRAKSPCLGGHPCTFVAVVRC